METEVLVSSSLFCFALISVQKFFPISDPVDQQQPQAYLQTLGGGLTEVAAPRAFPSLSHVS